MSEDDGIRIVLEQEGPYAFKVSFDGTALEALHTDEPAPLGEGMLVDFREPSGKIVMTKRRRGRPPKHPRPEDQLPVIPFPEHLRHLQPA